MVVSNHFHLEIRSKCCTIRKLRNDPVAVQRHKRFILRVFAMSVVVYEDIITSESRSNVPKHTVANPHFHHSVFHIRNVTFDSNVWSKVVHIDGEL